MNNSDTTAWYKHWQVQMKYLAHRLRAPLYLSIFKQVLHYSVRTFWNSKLPVWCRAFTADGGRPSAPWTWKFTGGGVRRDDPRICSSPRCPVAETVERSCQRVTYELITFGLSCALECVCVWWGDGNASFRCLKRTETCATKRFPPASQNVAHPHLTLTEKNKK